MQSLYRAERDNKTFMVGEWVDVWKELVVVFVGSVQALS